MKEPKPKYLVDGHGRKVAAILDLKEYRELVRYVEDLEDALALEQAARAAQRFRSYAEIREELRREGRL